MASQTTILLVEDTAELMETLRRLLEAAGYRVLCAVDAQQALEKLQSEAPNIDLLITDLLLPGMSGVDVAAWAARICPAMKVMFMSGVGERPDVQLPQGSVLLQKPFPGKVLLQKIAEMTG